MDHPQKAARGEPEPLPAGRRYVGTCPDAGGQGARRASHRNAAGVWARTGCPGGAGSGCAAAALGGQAGRTPGTWLPGGAAVRVELPQPGRVDSEHGHPIGLHMIWVTGQPAISIVGDHDVWTELTDVHH